MKRPNPALTKLDPVLPVAAGLVDPLATGLADSVAGEQEAGCSTTGCSPEGRPKRAFQSFSNGIEKGLRPGERWRSEDSSCCVDQPSDPGQKLLDRIGLGNWRKTVRSNRNVTPILVWPDLLGGSLLGTAGGSRRRTYDRDATSSGGSPAGSHLPTILRGCGTRHSGTRHSGAPCSDPCWNALELRQC